MAHTYKTAHAINSPDSAAVGAGAGQQVVARTFFRYALGELFLMTRIQ